MNDANRDNQQTPDDAHGMPGYPHDDNDSSKPKTGESEPGIETPEQGNDKVG
ncbi:hypothetical protein GIW70_20940 [Pseudomonas syringae]|nr:hypothetical protein [Pseudomonas syringae]MCF5070653.1 hypothetical protein [Pseudomonas syringae]